MACIEKRNNKDGSVTHRVSIRKKGIEIYKSFSNEEDAKLYIFYKERLIENMDNFDVPLKQRIKLNEIFEIKSSSLSNCDKKTHNDFDNSASKLMRVVPDKFYHEISYDEWLSAAKELMNIDVFRGAKNGSNMRKPSITTVRRYFACASSAVSHMQSLGVDLENMPLKVLQTFITPLMKKGDI